MMCSVDSTASNAYDSYGESKLYKVNFTSLNKCGTVEFRQLGATTDALKIEEWGKLIVRFCATSMNHESVSAGELVEKEEVDDAFEEIFTGKKFM
jgi:hypothetical protein